MRAGDHDGDDADMKLAQLLFPVVGEPSEEEADDVKELCRVIRGARSRTGASQERFERLFKDLADAGSTSDTELFEAILSEFDAADAAREEALRPMMDEIRAARRQKGVQNPNNAWDKIVTHAMTPPTHTPDGQRVDHVLEIRPIDAPARPRRVVEIDPKQMKATHQTPEFAEIVEQPSIYDRLARNWEASSSHLRVLDGGLSKKRSPVDLFRTEFARRGFKYGTRRLRVRDLFLHGAAQDIFGILGYSTMDQNHQDEIGTLELREKEGEVEIRVKIRIRNA